MTEHWITRHCEKSGGHKHAALDEAGYWEDMTFWHVSSRDIGQTNILRKLHARMIYEMGPELGGQGRLGSVGPALVGPD